MILKKCACCKKELDLSLFPKRKSTKDGLYNYCKRCKSSHDKEYRQRNKLKLSVISKKNYLKNKEKIKIYRKAWGQKNKKIIAEQRKEKRKTDVKYRLSHYVRARVRIALKYKKWKKESKFSKYIGCDSETLKKHLENKFESGMSWDNQGKWHIDHIIPLVRASNEQELYKLCHYTNLQPMWAYDNIKKGGR